MAHRAMAHRAMAHRAMQNFQARPLPQGPWFRAHSLDPLSSMFALPTDQGQIVGSSAGILVVLASVTVIEAEHASGRIKVLVQKNLSWSPWPRSTLSIRGDAGRVLIGQHSYDVPTPVFIIAGRYFVQHTAANGRISAYTVASLPAEAVLDLKAAR